MNRIIIALTAAVALCGMLPAVTSYDDGGNSQNPNPKDETFGNCLSLPVIWSDNITKDLRENTSMPIFNDEWWYVWGVEVTTGETLSCAPNLTDPTNCSDGRVPGDDPEIVYLQQRENNIWQAESLIVTAGNPEVHVDQIDWADNLEAVSWNNDSVVRTEVVLFQNLSDVSTFPMMKGYYMHHVYEQGIDEMWGTNATEYQSAIATVYSGCARMTIQKLEVPDNVDSVDDIEGNVSLTWNPETGEWDEDVNGTFFNSAVWESLDEDGPGNFSAEINVGGKVIYGYNWKVYDNGDGPGFYRVTFSLDPVHCQLNTFFTEGITSIVEYGLAEEDTDVIDVSEYEPTVDGTGENNNNNSKGEYNLPNDGVNSSNPDNFIPGGRAKIDFVNNLTYMDVQILEK